MPTDQGAGGVVQGFRGCGLRACAGMLLLARGLRLKVSANGPTTRKASYLHELESKLLVSPLMSL